MRLFVAIVPPETAREAIQDWWQQARHALTPRKWREVPMEQWHLTLAFFGDIDEQEVESLADSLAHAVVGRPPLRLALCAPGAFPRLARARSFWVGVDGCGPDDSQELSRLAAACRRMGPFTADGKPFRGHITLARSRGGAQRIQPEGLRELLPAPPIANWSVKELVLFRSQLRRQGPLYTELCHIEWNTGEMN